MNKLFDRRVVESSADSEWSRDEAVFVEDHAGTLPRRGRSADEDTGMREPSHFADETHVAEHNRTTTDDTFSRRGQATDENMETREPSRSADETLVAERDRTTTDAMLSRRGQATDENMETREPSRSADETFVAERDRTTTDAMLSRRGQSTDENTETRNPSRSTDETSVADRDSTITDRELFESQAPRRDEATATEKGSGGSNSRKSDNIPVPRRGDDSPKTPDFDPDSLLLKAATLEDTQLVLDLLANVTDAARSTLSIVALGQPQNGTATLNQDGTVLYVPNEDFSGTDSFNYTVSDGRGATVQATFEVAIGGVADRPMLNAPGSLSATAGETVVFELAAMVTDLDGSESLTVIVRDLPNGATLSAGHLRADGSWALSGGDLEGLKLFLSSEVVGSHNIRVTAKSTEASNGDTATVSRDIALSVAPVLTSGAALVTGGSGNDVMVGGSGNTEFRGAGGFDTVVYRGNINDYEISKNADGTMKVQALVSNEGTDTLQAVEAIRFADATYDAVRGRVMDEGEEFDGYVMNDGTAMVIGDGGKDVMVAGFRDTEFRGNLGYDTVVYQGNKDDYAVTDNADGTVTVRALVTDEGTDTLDSIELLRFADQDLVLVEPTATDGTDTGGTDTGGTDTGGTDTGGTDTGGTGNAVVKPDPMLQPSQPDDVVGLRLVNTTDAVSQDGFLTFGHVFAEGDLLPSSGLLARVNGVDIPVQVDVKATHADGSVRHAVLTMQAPDLAADAEADVMLVRTAPPVESALDPMSALGSYDLQLKLVINEADGTQTSHVIDAADLIADAFSAGGVKLWLSGPMAVEFSVSTPINELLDARFDVRIYADGEVRTDVVVSNDNTYAGVTPTTVNYDVEIIQNGGTDFSASGVSHHRNSNWHKEVWSGDGQSEAHLQYDVAYLVATGAIPAIDHSLGVKEDSLAFTYNSVNAADSLLGSSLVKQHMGGTGGRPDVGPITGWASQYVVSQDVRALEVMLAQADAGGSIPWHFQDAATGEWLNIDDRPLAWTFRGGTDGMADFDLDDGGWRPDTAHQPSLTFLPYLVTGSQYYANELAAQASYNLAWPNPGSRGEDAGLLDEQQVRGLAWSLRSLSEAAYALPDDHPLKDYFGEKLENNLDHLIQTYIVDGRLAEAGEVEGWFYRLLGKNPGGTQPWQQDFMSISLALADQRGFEAAGDLLAWAENFTTGRYLNADNGFDPLYGSVGMLRVFDPDTGELYSNWAQVFEESFGADGPSGTAGELGYPNSASSYILKAQSALAGHISANMSPDAIEAYGTIMAFSRDNGIWKSDSGSSVYHDPSWLLMPKLADGTYLTQDRVIHGSGDFAGTNGSQMLIGDDGADVIHGGDGIDFIFGLGGNDVLDSGAGNDFVFGGPGNDRLIGGEGDDHLKGAGGADTFVFDIDNSGRDTIADWDPSSDLLEIRQGINGMTETRAADILSRITDDGAGNAIVDLGAGNSVTLLGVASTDITASHVDLI